MPFLKVNLAEMGVVTPSFRHDLVVHRDSCEAIGLDAEQVVASGGADSENRSIAPTAFWLTLLVRAGCSQFKFTSDSTRDASGVGLDSKPGRELYSALRPGLPSGVVSADAGTGSP